MALETLILEELFQIRILLQKKFAASKRCWMVGGNENFFFPSIRIAFYDSKRASLSEEMFICKCGFVCRINNYCSRQISKLNRNFNAVVIRRKIRLINVFLVEFYCALAFIEEDIQCFEDCGFTDVILSDEHKKIADLYLNRVCISAESFDSNRSNFHRSSLSAEAKKFKRI